MKITVMCVVRDSADILPVCLKRLEAVGKGYDMEYYFYENDSKDNTVELLETWLLDKEGSVYSEILNAPSFGHTVERDRMERMAYYRNTLLDNIKPLDSDYCLLIDADIDYTPDIIDKYLPYMKDDVVMCTPYVKQSVKCNMCNCGKHSYYDTYALMDTDGNLGITLSCNPFSKSEDRELWNDKKPVTVTSAFGGVALIKTEVMNKVKWSTDGGCEHWNFCKEVNEHGDVIVIPTVESFVKIDKWELAPIQKQHQQKLIDDPWYRWSQKALSSNSNNRK